MRLRTVDVYGSAGIDGGDAKIQRPAKRKGSSALGNELGRLNRSVHLNEAVAGEMKLSGIDAAVEQHPALVVDDLQRQLVRTEDVAVDERIAGAPVGDRAVPVGIGQSEYVRSRHRINRVVAKGVEEG